MGRTLPTCALAALVYVAAPSAAAQDAGAPIATRVRVERADEGSIRRGDLDVPAWVAVGAGGLVALLAAGALTHRLARRRGR